MMKTSFAEWLLIRRCGKERTAEIVGDLYEQHGVSGSFPRIFGIWFALSWRWMAAVLLTVLAMQCFYAWHATLGVEWLRSIFRLTHHDARLFDWFNRVFVLNVIFWNITLLGVLRYGFSDSLTRVALTFGGAFALLRFSIFTPNMRVVLAALLAAAAIALIFAPRRLCRPILGVTAIAGTEAIVFWLFHFLWIPQWWWFRGPHHNLVQSIYCALPSLEWALCISVAAWVMARVHRRLHRSTDLSYVGD